MDVPTIGLQIIAYDGKQRDLREMKKISKTVDLIGGVEIAQNYRQSIENKTVNPPIFSSGCPIAWLSG